MDALNERIQSIRIGRNAPEKISSYFKYMDDVMKSDLSNQELEKLDGLFAKVDRGFILSTPKTKKSKKSTGGTSDDPQNPKRARKHTITGYGLFLKETCAELKAKKFSGNYLTQVSVLWKPLPDDEKKEWHEKARLANIALRETIGDATGDATGVATGDPPTLVRKKDLAAQKADSKGKPKGKPKVDRETNANGVGCNLGCSKCRYAVKGCGTCRSAIDADESDESESDADESDESEYDVGESESDVDEPDVDVPEIDQRINTLPPLESIATAMHEID